MNDGEARRRVLDRERAVNEQYLRKMRATVERSAGLERNVAATRNLTWSGRAPGSVMSPRVIGPIIGRVGLSEPDELLGTGFYIGPWHQEWETAQVVSWAAPKSKLFYEGRRANDELARRVAARRTFEVRGDDLRSYVDEPERGHDPEKVFADGTDSSLAVPAAPRPVARPARSGAVAPSGDSAEPEHPAPPPGQVLAAPTDAPALRAEAVVMEAIRSPKKGRLKAVLATLQPDQYRLVTWPDDQPLVVQGAPGTGKTIVATHRASFLTHRDRTPRPLRRVALIGPTEQYVEHVAEVQREIGGTVQIMSLPGVLRYFSRATPASRSLVGHRLDTAWRIGQVLERCARVLRKNGKLVGDRSRDARVLLREFLHPQTGFAPLFSDNEEFELEELDEWRLEIRSRERAMSDARYLPFLAAAHLAVAPPTADERFEHLVIDEAQDIRPLEWRIIDMMLEPGGTMSLFGDMNQRHSDWSPPSWTSLIEMLELGDADSQVEVQEMGVGFRSTKQILRFANQLLPRGQRSATALQDGPEPRVEKARRESLVGDVHRMAVELAGRYAQGTVAVISMQPTPHSDRMRNEGWSRGQARGSWRRDGHAVVHVLRPDEARGLEFDGVVVVEPADFPENLGRLGPLYTSLTRATKELAVVYCSRLPRDLKTRSR